MTVLSLEAGGSEGSGAEGVEGGEGVEGADKHVALAEASPE